MIDFLSSQKQTNKKEALVPSSALPIGATRSVKATTLTKVDPENARSMSNLLNLVLSIPQAEWDGVDAESDAAFEACSGPSLGFIHLLVFPSLPAFSLALQDRSLSLTVLDWLRVFFLSFHL